jgi:hypothetical protein
MFPIPQDRSLSLIDIADYWSREAQPPAKKREIFSELIKAWWRGEFVGTNGPIRLKVLKALFELRKDRISFVVPGHESAPQTEATEDGGLRITRPLSIRLPNDEPSSWDDEKCAPAYEALAEGWQFMEGDISEPAIGGVELTRDCFIKWLSKRGLWRPTFWGDIVQQKEISPSHPKRAVAKKGTAVTAARSFIAEFYPRGIPHGVTYKHVAKEMERQIGQTVSERTIRRAYGRR